MSFATAGRFCPNEHNELRCCTSSQKHHNILHAFDHKEPGGSTYSQTNPAQVSTSNHSAYHSQKRAPILKFMVPKHKSVSVNIEKPPPSFSLQNSTPPHRGLDQHHLLPNGQLEREYIENLRVQVKYLEHEVAFLREELCSTKEHILEEARIVTDKKIEDERKYFEMQWKKQAKMLQDAEDRYTSVCEAKASLEQKTKSLMSQREEEKHSFYTKLQQLHKEIEILQETGREKDTRTSRLREDIHSKISQIAEKDHRVRQLEVQLTDTRKLFEKARAQSEELQVEIVELKSELEAQQQSSTYSLTKSSNDESNEANSSNPLQHGTKTSAMRENSVAIIETLKEENRSLRSKMKQSELALQEGRAVEQRLRDDIDGLVHDNAKLANRISELETDNTQQQQQLQQERDNYSLLSDELRQIRTCDFKLKGQNETMEAEIESLRNQLHRSELALQHKEIELNTIEQDSFELREGISQIRRALEVSDITSLLMFNSASNYSTNTNESQLRHKDLK